MSVVSNNLANVNTTGFKRSAAAFQDLLYQNVRQVGGQTSQDTQLPSGMHLGAGVRVVATEKLFSQGNIVQSENPLHVAVQGRGFFQVLMPDGTLGYTRDGSFQMNTQGQLVTASGSPQTGTPGGSGLGTTTQGTLETSNVNVVQELVEMIETQRAYEINSKAVEASDGMLRYIINNT